MEQKYLIENLSTNQIAKMLNVGANTVWYKLKKYNIPIRSKSEAKKLKETKIDKKLLRDLYINEEMSITQISLKINETRDAVWKNLNRYGYIRTLSESKRGHLNHLWAGGITDRPYCFKFNNSFKEFIREKFNRKCFLCGKLEEDNGQKLSVHHIDYNKNSICNGKSWAFIPLCRQCHTKTNMKRWYWFSLLIYYWLYKFEVESYNF